jgi:hypothetical protein
MPITLKKPLDAAVSASVEKIARGASGAHASQRRVTSRTFATVHSHE